MPEIPSGFCTGSFGSECGTCTNIGAKLHWPFKKGLGFFLLFWTILVTCRGWTQMYGQLLVFYKIELAPIQCSCVVNVTDTDLPMCSGIFHTISHPLKHTAILIFKHILPHKYIQWANFSFYPPVPLPRP